MAASANAAASSASDGATHAASRPLDFQLRCQPPHSRGTIRQTSSVGSSSSTASPAFGPAHAPTPPRPRSPLSGVHGRRRWQLLQRRCERAIPSPMAVCYGSRFGSSNGQAARGVGGYRRMQQRMVKKCERALQLQLRFEQHHEPTEQWMAEQRDEPTPHCIHKRWPRPPPPPPPPRFRLPLHATPAETAPLPSRSRCSSTAIVERADARLPARWAAVARDEPGTASASASTSEVSASNWSSSCARVALGRWRAMGACGPLEGKLSIDVEQATASPAVSCRRCCSPPRHQLGAATQ